MTSALRITLVIAMSASPAWAEYITIEHPDTGHMIADTFIADGLFDVGVTDIQLIINHVETGAETTLTANVVSEGVWQVILEPGIAPAGQSVFTAMGTYEGDAIYSDDVVVLMGLPAGGEEMNHTSSVDGVPLLTQVYVPSTLVPEKNVPLYVHLHGGGGTGIALFSAGNGAVIDELEKRGWIGIGPDGRRWDLYHPDADLGCEWPTSTAYVNHPTDPAVGPGEQDVLDAIVAAVRRYPIDTDRIYLGGSSMGGRGAYAIGLRCSDIFAAIAPQGPATDMYEIYLRRPEPRNCKEGMLGGEPGDSDIVDTLYSITSARFLIENAYNLPVFHTHGLNDTAASNTLLESEYLHGWHVTSDSTFKSCHVGPDPDTGIERQLCFGKTPTLDELHRAYPQGYRWGLYFTDSGHGTNAKWYTGGSAVQSEHGVRDPTDAGRYIGVFDFFETCVRQWSPDTIVYKSYTDEHRRSHWARILISTPWQDLPGAIRATRGQVSNELHMELVRVRQTWIDLSGAGLSIDQASPLTIHLSELNEPLYDPALLPDPNHPLDPTVTLMGDFSDVAIVQATMDGAPLVVRKGARSIALKPGVITQPVTIQVSVSDH